MYRGRGSIAEAHWRQHRNWIHCEIHRLLMAMIDLVTQVLGISITRSYWTNQYNSMSTQWFHVTVIIDTFRGNMYLYKGYDHGMIQNQHFNSQPFIYINVLASRVNGGLWMDLSSKYKLKWDLTCYIWFEKSSLRKYILL